MDLVAGYALLRSPFAFSEEEPGLEHAKDPPLSTSVPL